MLGEKYICWGSRVRRQGGEKGSDYDPPIAQAHGFFRERGIEYSHPDGVGQLLRRGGVKLKTGPVLGTSKPTPRSRRLSKNFAARIRGLLGEGKKKKSLQVFAFEEARFDLIDWHRRRYSPKGFRPPYIVVRGSYNKWTYLYAAVEPTTGESFCL